MAKHVLSYVFKQSEYGFFFPYLTELFQRYLWQHDKKYYIKNTQT